MRTFSEKNKLILFWVEGLFLTLGILSVLYIKCGVYFETNDDRAINEILSGALTGKPDGHAIFVNYLLGGVLAFLYSVADNIPWYGGFLMFCHLAVYWSFFGLVFIRCRNFFQHLIAICCGIFLILSNMYIFGEIQYTSTAALLAAGGYLWLLLGKGKSKYVLFGLFELLSLLLRSQAMLMVQPIGVTIWCAGLLIQFLKKELTARQCCKEGLTVATSLLLCLVLAWGGNYILGDYGSDEWQEYRYYREVRSDIADFYGFPTYEQIDYILQKYDISENEYLAYTRYWMLNNEIDIACLEEIHQVAKASYKEARLSLEEVIEEVWEYRRNNFTMGYGEYGQSVYLIILLLILVNRKWSYLVGVVALNFSRNLLLGFLLWQGRLPFRVIGGLSAAEMLFLVAGVFVLGRELEKRKPILRWGVIVLIGALMYTNLEPMKRVYYALGETHASRENYSSGMNDLISYCEKSEKGYLVVEIATAYYTGKALQTDWNQPPNYISSGFWWSGSPRIEQYRKEYMNAHDADFRLIEIGEGMDPGQSYAVQLFTDDWGLELIPLEELELSNGVKLMVYDVQGPLEYQK